MFRFLLLAACLAGPAYAYSTGAPSNICTNGLTPEHHVPGQETPPPYSFSGADSVRAGEKISLAMGGGDFLGFAIQVRDAHKNPIGELKVVEDQKSQTLKCLNAADTLTHKKINRDAPINNVRFEWIAPAGYKGKATVTGTVAKDGAVFWIAKVLKDVQVQ